MDSSRNVWAKTRGGLTAPTESESKGTTDTCLAREPSRIQPLDRRWWCIALFCDAAGTGLDRRWRRLGHGSQKSSPWVMLNCASRKRPCFRGHIKSDFGITPSFQHSCKLVPNFCAVWVQIQSLKSPWEGHRPSICSSDHKPK